MTEPEVILSIIGVLGTAVGFLGWIIREQFNFNKSNIKENTKVIAELSEILEKVHKSFDDERVCRQEDTKQKQEFQNRVCKTLDKISTTQDEINNRQITLYKKVETEILEDNGSTTHTVTDTKVVKS